MTPNTALDAALSKNTKTAAPIGKALEPASILESLVVTNKTVRLVGIDIDFGGGYFVEADEAPLIGGTLSFREDGTTVEPRLLGTMHFHEALGVTARMQMRYYDAAGNVLATQVSSEHTATTSGHEDVPIDMAPYDNPTIRRVNVSTTVEAAGRWYTVTAQNYDLFDLGQPVDSVQLNEVDIDFGGPGFDGTSPTSAGELAWNVGVNGTIRPHLTGYLHMNQARGTTARMQLDYLDRQGSMIAREVGGAVSPSDWDHHVWSVDLDPFASPAIYQVRVYTTLQTSNGWGVVKSRLYTI